MDLVVVMLLALVVVLSLLMLYPKRIEWSDDGEEIPSSRRG